MTSKPTVIIDRHHLAEQARGNRYKLEPTQEAMTLSTYGKVLGAQGHMHAIVDEDDREGITAYTRAGFIVHAMNGNRASALLEFVTAQSVQLSLDPPGSLNVFSNDPVFNPMLRSVAEKGPPQSVTLWTWGETPASLWSPTYNTRRLEEILPGARVPRIALLFDWENVQLSLMRRGWRGSVKELVRGILEKLEPSGDVVLKKAYADFGVLNQQTGHDSQRDLAEANVEPVYVFSERGKNSADLVLSNAARDLLENQNGDAIEILALVTHDRDFKSIIETTRQRGRQVKLLAFRDGLSRHLVNAVPERDIIYLDDLLRRSQPAPDPRRAPSVPRLSPDESFVPFAMRCAEWLTRKQNWHFAPTAELYAALCPTEADLREVDKAITAGVMRRGQRRGPDGAEETLGFNLKHPKARAIHTVTPWTRDLIGHSLNHLRLPYVDSNRIAQRMQQHPELAALDVGQTRPEADRWLRALARATVIIPQEQERPGSSDGKIITTWSLPTNQPPAAAPATAATAPTAEPPTGDPAPTAPPQPTTAETGRPQQPRPWTHHPGTYASRKSAGTWVFAGSA